MTLAVAGAASTALPAVARDIRIMTRPGGADPRYLIVFGACMTQFMVIGLLFSYGVLFKSLEIEFGWSRTLLSAGTSLAFLMMGTFAIVGGRLSDRYGPRIVLTASGLIYGCGIAALSLVSAPWQLFLIFGIPLGLGLSTHDVVTLSTVARWFQNRRGVMTGVVKVGTAAGQVTLPPLCAMLIASVGWRSAVVVLGVAAIVLLLAAAQAMKAPADPGPSRTRAAGDGSDWAMARGSRVFWTLCAIQFLFFPSLMTVPVHIAVHGMGLGLSQAVAATLISTIGAASIVGRLTVGTLSDRIRGRNAYVVCFVPLILSLCALAVIQSPAPLFAAIAVYGFAHGGFFTVVSPTVAEYFGTRAHGTIFGVVLFFGTIGGAIGPILAGRIFDTLGSYDWAFGTLATLACLGLGLVLTLPRSPERTLHAEGLSGSRGTP